MKITTSSTGLLKPEAQQELVDAILTQLKREATDDPEWILDFLIDALDEADGDDAFGTEGWRHRFGLDG